MLEQLLHIDTEILLAINGWHAPWADTLMWIVSAKTTWIPLYLLLIVLLARRYRRPAMTSVKWLQRVPAGAVIILVIGLAVGAADFIASGILKELVARPRPTRVAELEGVLHLVNGYRSGQYGFVSSHAANTMVVALLFSLIWRNKIATVGLMLWVAANCYSRMYLGVHYPTDILGGLIVGVLVAAVAYWWLGRCHLVENQSYQ
jgi:undecaprenyl-diphosphatase